jgi:hypothetical protein
MLLGSIAFTDFADGVCRIAASGDAIERTAPFRSQTVGTIRALSQRLDVGANDIADPADFGVAEDFVDADFLLAKTILQSFYCDIESDFAPKFETVGDRLRD